MMDFVEVRTECGVITVIAPYRVGDWCVACAEVTADDDDHDTAFFSVTYVPSGMKIWDGRSLMRAIWCCDAAAEVFAGVDPVADSACNAERAAAVMARVDGFLDKAQDVLEKKS